MSQLRQHSKFKMVDVDVSYAPERNIDITDIIIFQAIVSIREKKQRADNKTIFDYINKNSASNFTEEYIAERVETLMEDEKLSNKKTYRGMDSFYLTEISQSFIDSKQVEPEVIAVNTPLLQRTCGQVWDGDWGSTEETSETLRMLEAKFVALKSFMMNEIYELKEKIKQISTPITGNGKENWLFVTRPVWPESTKDDNTSSDQLSSADTLAMQQLSCILPLKQKGPPKLDIDKEKLKKSSRKIQLCNF